MSTLIYNFLIITKLCLKKKRSHLPFECDFVNSTVKYYLPSLGGTEREESYSFGNSDKIQKCMQLPHLFREHFRTYNILDSILRPIGTSLPSKNFTALCRNIYSGR